MKELGNTLVLPHDHIVAKAFSAEAEHKEADEIPDGWMGLDIGSDSAERYRRLVTEAKTILWNGPMGVFEMQPYAKGTFTIAKAMAEATQNHDALTVVGGGDSVAAINAAGLAEAVTHVSTGGGAMLEFIEGKTLPGVAALS